MSTPFETFETWTNGKVYTCCSAWMTVHIGKLEQAPTDHDICARNHPEHEQFLEVLRDPILCAADIDCGNIGPFFDATSEFVKGLGGDHLN